MFHLFANNVHCKHIVFGCCHDSSYRVALDKYVGDPFMAFKLTLLKSYETNPSFEGLVFDSVKFPRVFRSTPYKETEISGEEDVDRSRAKEGSETNQAIARWRANARASTSISPIAGTDTGAHTNPAVRVAQGAISFGGKSDRVAFRA